MNSKYTDLTCTIHTLHVCLLTSPCSFYLQYIESLEARLKEAAQKNSNLLQQNTTLRKQVSLLEKEVCLVDWVGLVVQW